MYCMSCSGVVLSIIAGKRVEDIQGKFNTKLVIRTMPNTPATIMQGMTVWYPAKEVPKGAVEQAQQLLGLTGTAMQVKEEGTLDMVSHSVTHSVKSVSQLHDFRLHGCRLHGSHFHLLEIDYDNVSKVSCSML
jgi:hypothetical protein